VSRLLNQHTPELACGIWAAADNGGNKTALPVATADAPNASALRLVQSSECRSREGEGLPVPLIVSLLIVPPAEFYWRS